MGGHGGFEQGRRLSAGWVLRGATAGTRAIYLFKLNVIYLIFIKGVLGLRGGANHVDGPHRRGRWSEPPTNLFLVFCLTCSPRL